MTMTSINWKKKKTSNISPTWTLRYRIPNATLYPLLLLSIAKANLRFGWGLPQCVSTVGWVSCWDWRKTRIVNYSRVPSNYAFVLNQNVRYPPLTGYIFDLVGGTHLQLTKDERIDDNIVISKTTTALHLITHLSTMEPWGSQFPRKAHPANPPGTVRPIGAWGNNSRAALPPDFFATCRPQAGS
jgi:hypothetical protein